MEDKSSVLYKGKYSRDFFTLTTVADVAEV